VEKPSRELSIGEILSLTLNLYLSKFLQFFLPFLIAGIITGLSMYAIMSSFPLPEQPSVNAPSQEIFEWFVALITTAITIGVLSALVGWIVTTPTTGIVTKCASDQIEKGTSTLGASINFTIPKLPSLLIAQLVTGILIVIGLFLLFIPGIIITIMFSLIMPAIIVEQKGAFESLGRSRKLVSNRWLKTFALLLILGIIVVVVTIVVNLLATPLNFTYPNSNLIITSMASSFVAPISPIALTYLYYAMVAREIPPTSATSLLTHTTRLGKNIQ
jgi:hypothetical protein